jgi:hypothetical protein
MNWSKIAALSLSLCLPAVVSAAEHGQTAEPAAAQSEQPEARGNDMSGKGFGSAAQGSTQGGAATDTGGTGGDGSTPQVDKGADGQPTADPGTSGTGGEGGARGAY